MEHKELFKDLLLMGAEYKELLFKRGMAQDIDMQVAIDYDLEHINQKIIKIFGLDTGSKILDLIRTL